MKWKLVAMPIRTMISDATKICLQAKRKKEKDENYGGHDNRDALVSPVSYLS